MQTNNFINQLKSHPNLELQFTYPKHFNVESHFHLTEVKNLTINSVDCGGSQNSWNETVIQLWSGSQQDDGHRLTTDKFLSIIEKVDSISALDLDAEVLIEYSNEDFHWSHYQIDSIEVNEAVMVKLSTKSTQCKGIKSDSDCCNTQNSACCS